MNTLRHAVSTTPTIERNHQMSKRRLADRRGLVEYLGGTVSPDAIATWVHAGKIRPIQLHAKKWLFDLDDIDNLLDRLKRGPEPISA